MADVNKSKATNEMFSQREGGVWPAEQLLHIGLHLSLYRKKPQKAFIMSLNASHMSCVYIRGKRVDIVQLAPQKCRCPSYHTRSGRGTTSRQQSHFQYFWTMRTSCLLSTHMCDLSKRSRKPAVASPWWTILLHQILLASHNGIICKPIVPLLVLKLRHY